MAFSVANAEHLKEAQQLREEMRTAYENLGAKKFPRSDLTEFLTKENNETTSPEALDLLRKLLRLNPSERLTARQALQHPFLKQ